VLRLVQTVERLDNEDQERILKLVNLLMIAPASVRDRTQIMLRRLLDRDMRSMLDCIAAVDELLEYLEASAGAPDAYADAWRLWELPAPSTTRN
jgi:hypothetical protein